MGAEPPLCTPGCPQGRGWSSGPPLDPPGTQPTPAQGFPWAESERGKAFPVPVPASAGPRPGQGHPKARVPQRAVPSLTPLPPSSPSNRLRTQTGSRLGTDRCPPNSVEMGGRPGPWMGTWESHPGDTTGVGVQNWGVPKAVGCWGWRVGAPGSCLGKVLGRCWFCSGGAGGLEGVPAL